MVFIKNFIKGALIGGAVTGISGILFAPQSGKKTRSDIKFKSDEIINDTKKFCKRSKKKVQKNFQKK